MNPISDLAARHAISLALLALMLVAAAALSPTPSTHAQTVPQLSVGFKAAALQCSITKGLGPGQKLDITDNTGRHVLHTVTNRFPTVVIDGQSYDATGSGYTIGETGINIYCGSEWLLISVPCGYGVSEVPVPVPTEPAPAPAPAPPPYWWNSPYRQQWAWN